MIDITTIPAERMFMLDTATLFHGSHGPGGADCQHCARELLYEIVTGQHKDATPPGTSEWIDILPALNDGPWRDDNHRTQVMRPYLKLLLSLDPAEDQARLWPFLDYVYRSLAPDLLDALKMSSEAAALRAAGQVTDQKSARALARASAVARASDLARALARASAVARARDLARALDLASALALARASDLARALDALALARASALDALARASASASDALARASASASDLARALDALALASDPEARAARWEKITRDILDRICANPSKGTAP